MAAEYAQRLKFGPQQAAAFKIGRIRIMQLLEEARTAVGPEFDIRTSTT